MKKAKAERTGFPQPGQKDTDRDGESKCLCVEMAWLLGNSKHQDNNTMEWMTALPVLYLETMENKEEGKVLDLAWNTRQAWPVSSCRKAVYGEE